MKLNAVKLGLTAGILWALCMLALTYYPELSLKVIGVVKGEALRAFLEDSYPWYDHTTWYAPLVGVGWGFVDGFFHAVIFGWLYNLLVGKKK